MTDQRIYLQLGRIGDILNIAPLAYDDAQQGRRSAIMVAKEFAPVLDGCSYVDRIVFDGNMGELERAQIEAKQQSSDVLCVQLVGPLEIVKQIVATRNGHEYRTTKESFLKDQWNLAGRMNDWKRQLPLVFDQRSPEREEALAKGVINPKKKNILVSTRGTSSPFPYGELLLELLRLKFRTGWNIVDLSEVKAERFYDLLGLYERAHCIVSTDSAPLHLAYAVKVPVVAFVNDTPSYWHGSTWRPNHIFHCRYHDFPIRGVQMLEAIKDIGEPGCFFMEGRTAPNLIHVWSQYEVSEDNRKSHEAARASWEAEHFSCAGAIKCPAETGVFGVDSLIHPQVKDDKHFPFVWDVIRLATLRAQDDDVICLTRALSCVRPNAFNAILAARDRLPIFCHREIMDGKYPIYHPAVDLFAFTKRWWREHQLEYPNMVLGNDSYWHRVLWELLKKHGGTEVPGLVYRARIEGDKPIADPPRKKHNEECARKWLEAHSVTCTVRPVAEQVKAYPVNRRALFPYGYNPSLIRFNGRMLMAYRWHEEGTFGTKLALAELDDKGNVTNNLKLETDGHSLEDPRLFIHGGKLHVCYVDACWPSTNPTCVTKYGKLAEGVTWTIKDPVQLEYGKNDFQNLEKNWAFFEHGGKLMMMYSAWPEQVIVEIDNGKVVTEHKTEGIRWPWGPVKSGMTPIPYKDKLLRFFHSALDNEPRPWKRRYYMGAMLMEPEPPFRAIAISKEPIVRGSEEDDLSATERSGCFHRKANVIFPMGCVPINGGWLVSAGVNDACSVLLHLTEADLKL